MEWISVDERLPDVIGDYLIYDECGKIAWAFFYSDKKWAYWDNEKDNGAFYKFVTHWMPLPEPPK